jgi:hypothetical protein
MNEKLVVEFHIKPITWLIVIIISTLMWVGIIKLILFIASLFGG